MSTTAAGILLYRYIEDLEVFLVHPGGPFWSKKDIKSWSIPKGVIEDSEPTKENLLKNALREFSEEVGFKLEETEGWDRSKLRDIGSIKMKSGKVVQAFAYEYPYEISKIRSNKAKIVWPPKSGKEIEIPEVDKGEWFKMDIARMKINEGQAPLLEKLIDSLK